MFLVAPELVWGLIPRFIGLIYVVAFASVGHQLPLLIGSRGLGAMGPRLTALRRDFPGWRAFHAMPTVLWLSHSDRTLRLIPMLGVTAGLACIYGGPLAPAAHVLAWMLWLSLEPASLIFPWDTMLQEAGFLCLFLPHVQALPALEASALPYPSVAFVFRFFVLRLMLGFGKVKFLGSRRDDALYLRGFFAWSSITPASWLAHHLPAWVLRLMLLGMFVCEVIAPVLGFFTGAPRLVAFVLLTGLMIMIEIMGNWSFFNLGYALLCVCLLDTSSSIFDLAQEPWRSGLTSPSALALNASMAILFVTGLLYLVASDSWTTRTAIHWPSYRYTWNRRWLRALLAYLRAISPLRIVNGYGVFPPNSLPPMLLVPVFEGSQDGVSWLPYRFRYLPSVSTDPPRFIAPYQARLDSVAAYATTCVFDASFWGALAGDGSAYAAYTRSSWLERVCQRVMENDRIFIDAFRDNPFPDAPPKLMRVSAVLLTPTRIEVQRATGDYWHMRRCGVFVPALAHAEWPTDIALPEPEVFHPDWVAYKKRSAPMRAVSAALDAGEPPERAILAGSDLEADEVARFWSELVPRVNQRRGEFAHYTTEADAIVAQFGMVKLARYERILERLAWLIRLRTERHWYRAQEPALPLESNFRYHLFLQELVMDGREAYLAYLADPARVIARVAQSSDERQLWTVAVLRPRVMFSHIATLRWTVAGSDTFQRKLHGLFEFYPLLSSVELPGEEFRPVITKHADGEFTIGGMYPAPTLAEVRASRSP